MNVKATAAVTAVSAMMALGGCGGEADVAADEGVGVRQQALVAGNWGEHSQGVVVGSGGDIGNLMVCRAYFDHGDHPGKVWENLCLFGWGGLEKKTSVFQTLLDEGYTWESPGKWVNGQFVIALPQNAVDGGSAGAAGNYVRMGVCQAREGSNWHPGKWYANNCNYGYAGREQRRRPYASDPTDYVQVLVKR
jgi:Protein of unknown function (DUF3421)